MEEEFRFHVDMETRRLMKEGVPADDARRRALLAFGGLDVHRETMRDERGARWFEDILADVRYALRAMRRSPGLALAVAITFGVGIGVNGVIFGYINSIFFRPVPARAPEQLVAMFLRDTRTGAIDNMAYEDYVDYRDRSGVFGMNTRDRALISVNVGLQGYDETRRRRFYDAALARVRALPGVAAASYVFPAPFDTYGRGISLYVEGFRGSRDGTIGVRASFVGDGFVPALGLRLQGGRDFTQADTANAPLVMIVSRSLATRLWPGRDPVGQRARRGEASGPEITVVGVVGDAKFAMIGPATDARAYVPLRQRYRDWETLVVATRGRSAAILPRIRDVIAGIDPSLPTFGAMTMDDAVASGFASSRSAAVVGSLFGALTLLIASVGLYAVVASGVSERTREIGVRAALGATPMRLLRELMRGGARLGVVGLGIGLVLAFAVAKTMASLLLGVRPSDPFTFAIVPLTLGAVVLVATYLPARRAVNRDPVAALRAE